MGQFNPFVGSSSGGGGGGGSSSDGRGITSIVFMSSTGGSTAGIAGATDTYKINYSDGTSSTFVVKNGSNGTNGTNGVDGDPGTPGVGIQSVTFTSSSKGDQPSLEGATDTYTISYTNSTTSTFNVYNGEDGKRILLRVANNAIQYKYETNLSWTNLISLSELKGQQGEQGEKGEKGDPGEPGANGSNGDSAYEVAVKNGFVGTEDDWLLSLKGDKGDKGDKGNDGSVGPQGPAGENGNNGNDGISVTNAVVNNSGELIITLSNDEKLNAGVVKGADGTSINIIDELTSTSELPISGQNKGDSYLIGGDLWLYTGSTDADAVNGFKNVGTIQGPAGRGIQSLTINLQGELVVTYTDGSENNLGKVTGDDGNNGDSAYEIAVKNGFSDTETAWLASLKGDKGDKGDKGNKGDPGNDGLSAYEIWQGLGNTGTEQDFVGSLKGEQGEVGSAGDPGVGIQSIAFTSSSVGDTPSIAGATDTYTITLTNGNTSTFTVYNGANGTGSETTVVVDNAISATSENPVQNKVIKAYIDEIVGDISTVLATLTTLEEGGNA